MSVRICPRCSTVIESASAIFCYSCGQELNYVNPVEARAAPPPGASSSEGNIPKRNSLSLFAATVIVLLTVILAVSLGYFYFLRPERPGVLVKPSSNEFVSTISALPISPFTFGKYNFAGLVPAASDLYLESINPKVFLEKYLSEPAQKTLEEKVGLNVDEILSFFEREFAFVESSSSAAIIGVVKDSEFVKNRVEKLSSKEFPAKVMDTFLVVSNSANLLSEIENAYKKVSLSLLATSPFTETVKNLPKEGQLLIYATGKKSGMSALNIYFSGKISSAAGSLNGNSYVIDALSGTTVIKGVYGK